MGSDSVEGEELSRRGLLKGVLKFGSGLFFREPITRLEKSRLYRIHQGEISPFTPKSKLRFDEEHAPQSPDKSPFTEAEVTSEIDLRKYYFVGGFDNAQFRDGTPVSPKNFFMALMALVKYGENSYWSPSPNDISGWIYKKIYGLFRPESDSTHWQPPHGQEWAITKGHWPPVEGFWSSPAVLNIHNNFWNLDPDNPDPDKVAYLPSVYELYPQVRVALGSENPELVRSVAETFAGKIYLYGKFKPGDSGEEGDPGAPYLIATVVDKQVIPLGQEAEIHQIAGLIRDERGCTLWPLVSCFPLTATQQETDQRYVQWLTIEKIAGSN